MLNGCLSVYVDLSVLPCFPLSRRQPGDDEFDVIPGSQFCVSRTAFTDNSSHYQIDGKRVQYREVAALLRGNGIDLDHNRFLILQVCLRLLALIEDSFNLPVIIFYRK